MDSIKSLIDAGYIVVNANTCFNCKEESEIRLAVCLKIKECDIDLFLPFIGVSIPFCETCHSFYKTIEDGPAFDDKDYTRLLNNTTDLLETLGEDGCEILNNREEYQ